MLESELADRAADRTIQREARIVSEARILRLPCRADKMEKDSNWSAMRV